jgi:hypothetical protein
MDPDAALDEIRTIISQPESDRGHNRLAELIGVLDEWITNGGYLPAT